MQGDDPKLFHDIRAPQWPNQCIMPTVAKKDSRRLLEEVVSRKQAEIACGAWVNDFDLCVADVLATGDLEIAEAGGY